MFMGLEESTRLVRNTGWEVVRRQLVREVIARRLSEGP